MSANFCKLCGQPREKDIKSHLIPDWMIKMAADEHGRISVLSPTDLDHPNYTHRLRPRNKQGQDIDLYLLCSECEIRIGLWEDYAKRTLVMSEGIVRTTHKGKSPDGRRVLQWEEIAGLDYEMTKLFVLSIAWRLSVSNIQMALQTSIRAHEEPIRQMLLARQPGPTNHYPVAVYKAFLGRDRFTFTAAYHSEFEGTDILNVHGGGFWFMIHLTTDPLEPELAKLYVAPGQPLPVPTIDAQSIPLVRQMYIR